MLPKFSVTSEGNDTTTTVRINKIENGFILRTGGRPIHYPDITKLAKAVSEGILAINWEEPNDRTNKPKSNKP
jgi:hypothetical protein